MLLCEAAKGRNNNLDFIRFVCAISVILGHAFPISLGANFTDPLSEISKGQFAFGGSAVLIFFFYGGFLVAGSMERLKTARAYFTARIARLIPSLTIVTFVSVIGGAIITSLNPVQYFTDIRTYKFLLNSVLVLVHELPGVFENNIYGATINGALWTLPVEFICYIMCFAVYKFGFMTPKRMLWTVLGFVTGYFILRVFLGNGLLAAALAPTGFFYAGMLYYVYRDSVKLNVWIAVACFWGIILAACFGLAEYAIFFMEPYLLLYLAYGTKHKLSKFSKHGEISYGMYLCGWPVQQCVCMMFGGKMQPMVNAVIAVAIVIALGYVLHYMVERPVATWVKKNNQFDRCKEIKN